MRASRPFPGSYVYVAGASTRKLEVNLFMDRMVDAGYRISSRWPSAIGSGPANEGVPDDIRLGQSVHMEVSIRRSDFLVILLPPRDLIAKAEYSIGSWVEVGIAIGVKIPWWTVGPNRDRTIVTSLAGHFDTQDEAIGFFGGRSNG